LTALKSKPTPFQSQFNEKLGAFINNPACKIILTRNCFCLFCHCRGTEPGFFDWPLDAKKMDCSPAGKTWILWKWFLLTVVLAVSPAPLLAYLGVIRLEAFLGISK
jgi:hypothetical protein